MVHSTSKNQKTSPTVRTDEGHLALHEAALGGHLSVVRLLVASQPGMLEAMKLFFFESLSR